MPCGYLNEVVTYEAACLEPSSFDTLEAVKLKLASEGSAKIAEDRRNWFYVPSNATLFRINFPPAKDLTSSNFSTTRSSSILKPHQMSSCTYHDNDGT
jgi:hypothetical protein